MDGLAQELIDEIIDHLDKPDLKSCSLVSRSFLPRTRTHLFQHITIPSQRNLQVQDIPRAYIRSIHLTGHVGVPLDLPNVSHASFTSILYASDPFIHSLKGVHTISLTGTSIFIRDPAVLSAFLVRFPHLITLNVDCYMQFRCWEQPKDVPKIDKLRVELKGSYTRWVIALAQNVRRLELINASATDIRQILDAPTSNLQQLVLRNFQIGLGLLDMSNLVQLSIDLPDQRAVDWWEAILLLSPPRHVHIALHIPSGLPLAAALPKLGVEVVVEPHCKLTEVETQEYKALLCPVKS
ncbi:uncharacterized protein EV420DRAFT_1634265 [Desarmillaria tabescens]|uniref:F-box domain-containing protein n=1 Tax=Armillaria tabescens TaxID=1929756 RepID=A0AA39T7H3_ARMTA|nr:uncharacterized protein EV420DRAFT_1634265 [Desarmillaria tabescens]KAK0469856.1 hypothetical protein EV420DRAFT_1634265 [Desarmillaria tabescens]